MAPWPAITLAGGVVGGLMGLFGVGGSSVATPVLSLLGVPPLVAVASPLVATIPGATIAAVPYVRSGDARPRAAAWSLLGAVPATVVGALLSRLVGGPALPHRVRAGVAHRWCPSAVADRRCGTGSRHPQAAEPAAARRLRRRVGPVHRGRRLLSARPAAPQAGPPPPACPWHPPSARLRRVTLAVRRGVGSFDDRSASGR